MLCGFIVRVSGSLGGPDPWFILTVCPDMDLPVFQATPVVERDVTSIGA
jgi:hypothetical protein